MRKLILALTLMPLPAMAHGVHVVPMDGHPHGVLAYLIGAGVVLGAGVAVWMLTRAQ